MFRRQSYGRPLLSILSPAQQDSSELVIASHTDPGVLTLLLQDQFGGLQVKHEGKWVNVKPIQVEYTVKLAASGFVFLKDLRPEEPEVLSLTDAPASASATTTNSDDADAPVQQGTVAAMAVDEEPQPPQPFEYTS
ncbi:hypothetical protein SOVF_079920 [Spinacia oleracea]|nr:hypothetical protein SOVF_079920 [Spinacia oleracea]